MGILQGLCAYAPPISSSPVNQLYGAWKGMSGDDRIFYSRLDGSKWLGQQQIPNVESSVGPSLAVFNNKLYAVFKGAVDDQTLRYASFDGIIWSGEQPIAGVGSGGVGPSLAVFNNKLYAACRGPGITQYLQYASFDGSYWSTGKPIPGTSSSVGPSLAVFNNKLYAAWKGMGTDERLWYASFDGLNWSPQNIIPGVGSSVGPSLAVFNNKLYAAWKGAVDDQTLWYASFDGLKWSSQKPIPDVASSIGPALAVYSGKLYAMWKGMGIDERLWYASFDGLNWSAQALGPGFTGPDLAPPPDLGLSSNSNYILDSNCEFLKGVSICFNVTKDIICQSTSDSILGFCFQLNAYSPVKNQQNAWQQYCIEVKGKSILSVFNCWTSISLPNFADTCYLVPTPDNKIPAGYKLQIILLNDSQDNVTGARYVVIDNNGKILINATRNLTSIPGITSSDLAPIVAFQVNLVGPENKEKVKLSSGAGTIIYKADSFLMPHQRVPNCAAVATLTAETANTSYDMLPSLPCTEFIQPFSAEP